MNDWITGRAFVPEVGKVYDIAFGTVTHKGKTGNWTATVRIDGPLPSQWFDVEEDAPLDEGLAQFSVQAYSEV